MVLFVHLFGARFLDSGDLSPWVLMRSRRKDPHQRQVPSISPRHVNHEEQCEWVMEQEGHQAL